MPLNSNADLIQITNWSNENLTENNRIKACCQEVKNVPEIKGIYFWFMNHSCYENLSHFIEIESTPPHYQRTVNRRVYDLVYLGTAGVRNNLNVVNNGHLSQRIKWHLCDYKSVSSLCSGTMSTLRRTIGALISDDLIENNAQNMIDYVFCESFLIYWIEYPGDFIEVKDIVNSDESILINTLTPIFNLDKNINALNPNHVTFRIKERRIQVERSSKKRRCNSGKETSNSKKAHRVTPPDIIQNKLSNTEGEIKVTVTKDQSIAEQIQGINNLPIGSCRFICYDSENPTVIIYASQRRNGWRQTGAGEQNIYTYFTAPDTQQGNQIRWRIIQNEMIERNIKEITVCIFPVY